MDGRQHRCPTQGKSARRRLDVALAGIYERGGRSIALT